VTVYSSGCVRDHLVDCQHNPPNLFVCYAIHVCASVCLSPPIIIFCAVRIVSKEYIRPVRPKISCNICVLEMACSFAFVGQFKVTSQDLPVGTKNNYLRSTSDRLACLFITFSIKDLAEA
jgi:hypothetical protein